MAGGNMLRLIQGISSLSVYSTPWSISQRCISNKNLVEKLGLPEKPRKPISPFLEFKSNMTSEIQRKNPNSSVRDICKIAAKLWNASPQEKKDKYSEEYKKKYEKYKLELEKYEKLLTPEQKAELRDASEDMKMMKERKVAKRIKTKKETELKKPIKPSNAYLRFVRTEAVDETAIQHAKIMSEKWSNLPNEQKRKFIHEYEKEYAQYLKDLDAWEQEMINLGHVDLVRVKTLKEKLKSKAK